MMRSQKKLMVSREQYKKALLQGVKTRGATLNETMGSERHRRVFWINLSPDYSVPKVCELTSDESIILVIISSRG